MKHPLLPLVLCVLSLVFLTACDTTKPNVPPPSLGGITRAIETAGDLNTQAKKIAKEIQDKGTPAQSVPSAQLVGLLDDVSQAHAYALADVQAKTKEIADVTDARNKAVADVVYWKGKHTKALKELWIWRVIALVFVLWTFKGPIIKLVRLCFGLPSLPLFLLASFIWWGSG